MDSNYVITSSPGLKKQKQKEKSELDYTGKETYSYAHLHTLYVTFLFTCNVVGQRGVLSHIKIKNCARYRKIRLSQSGLMKVLGKKSNSSTAQ